MSKNLRKVIKKVLNENLRINEAPNQGWGSGQMGFGKSRDYETINSPSSTGDEDANRDATITVALDRIKSNLSKLGISTPDMEGFYTKEMLSLNSFDINFVIQSEGNEWSERDYKNITTKARLNTKESKIRGTIVLDLKQNNWKMIFDKNDVETPIPGTRVKKLALKKGNNYDIILEGVGSEVFDGYEESNSTEHSIKLLDIRGLGEDPKSKDKGSFSVRVNVERNIDQAKTDEGLDLLDDLIDKGVSGELSKSKKNKNEYVLRTNQVFNNALIIIYEKEGEPLSLQDMVKSGQFNGETFKIKNNAFGKGNDTVRVIGTIKTK